MRTPRTLSWVLACMFFCCFQLSTTTAQIDYTANDRVLNLDEDFGYGINLGYYPNWNNFELGVLSAGDPAQGVPGIGANTSRPALYEAFLEDWGYEFPLATFEYYASLGFNNHSVLVGDPSWAHRDQTQYCPGSPSGVFANLYEPIWDNGENGTPVNENNYFASYLYKVGTIYGQYVKVWEILNEPDFDLAGYNWYYEDQNQGWWVRDPDPCEYQLQAPIEHYVRTLRIAWEVLKTVDPDSYVSIGALGYPHWFDAAMRNTDNPNGGGVTAEYPYGAGAYFDIMGYHTYPHIDGSLWDYNRGLDQITGFNRHSDQAIAGMIRKKVEFDEVLAKYGYDGSVYPAKAYTITESNLPRASFSDPRYHGTLEMQINYVIKSTVVAQKLGVKQYHIFKLGDEKPDNQATFEFEVMGMYTNMEGTNINAPQRTEAGIAYKTTSDLLGGKRYDAARTAALNLPSNVDGGAFRADDGTYVYVLWGKTTIDRSEYAETYYTFPFEEMSQVVVRQWNYSDSRDIQTIQGRGLTLTGAPVFITADRLPTDGEDGGDPGDGGGGDGGGDGGGGSQGMDLSLKMSVDNPSNGIWQNRTFTLDVTNEGTEAANNVVVDFKIPDGFAFTTQELTQGDYFNWVGEWNVGSINAGQSARFTLTLFTISNAPATVYAQVINASPQDADSSPGNGNCCTPNEDDEAAITLGGGSPIGLQRANNGTEDVPYMTLHRLFPQPAADELYVSFSSPATDVTMTVYDVNGQKMFTQDVNGDKGFKQVRADVSQLPNGFYLISLDSTEGSETIRFVKMAK